MLMFSVAGLEAWVSNGTNLAAMVAAVSAVAAVYRYYRNSVRDKRDLEKTQARTAVAESLNFFADEYVRKALSALDYSEPVTMRALRIHSRTYESVPKEEFDEAEKQALDMIDQLLTRLELIDFLIDKEVISAAHFAEQFNYWLILLGELPSPGDKLTHFSDDNRQALWNYIRIYEFNGVIRLFARYGRASPQSGRPEALFRKRLQSAGASDGNDVSIGGLVES
jgi:hypothetical protein